MEALMATCSQVGHGPQPSLWDPKGHGGGSFVGSESSKSENVSRKMLDAE